MKFFFDTYAIIEIVNGNPNYAHFQDEIILTSVLNLGELYYSFLKEGNQAKAEVWFEQLKPDLIEADPETMKRAMIFRYAHRKKKMSMVDCVGYALARKLGILFLTGDQAFQGLPDVEFVK